ncbi:CARDB domain-containing protein [Nonomuraea jiangxiensis]|uniref:Conserved repeat domain-containing protein n=1 Tax=Nonomuraea jiangxiensis TaxID=633440 RepID=A0A1G9KWX5_9ACTN|nr:CARDB domain-containing protein [Nonomuraea jiangxiensis]SDL54044.1 conserved repeat domain-containing protein [Nonomuraea jiangxiensis]
MLRHVFLWHHVAFAPARQSGWLRRWTAPAAALVLVATVLAGLAGPAQAAWPGDNGKIYFVDQSTEPDGEIYSINPDGTGLTKITDNTAYDNYPTANADATKIAFTRFASGALQVWTMNPDGTGETQITTGAGLIDFSITWSPDGAKIAYTSLGGSISTINADGTGNVSLGVFGDSPAWSPDGTKIAYRAGNNIFTVNPDGTGATQVTSYSGAQSAILPDWSPDGSKITYTLSAIDELGGGSDNIYVMNANGTGHTALTNDGVSALSQWSPDGTKIAYTTGADPAVMNANGTGKTILAGISGFQYATDWAPAPSGADLAVQVADSADPVNLGSTFTDTVTVTNNGPAGATGVTATLALSGSASAGIVSATPSQGSCTVTTTVSCSLGSLASSASATVTVTLSPTTTGTVTATAGVDATEADPTQANDSDAENTTIVAADLDIDLTAQPHLGILVPYLSYRLTARNDGPDAVTSATLTATLPAGKTATNLSAGCTSTPGRVTCTSTGIADGATATYTFRLPIGLLKIGPVPVTATRTTSTPADPNPANDSASATCTVISVVLATCS